MEMTLNRAGRRKFEHVETELGTHEYLIFFVSVLSQILVTGIDLVRSSKTTIWYVV